MIALLPNDSQTSKLSLDGWQSFLFECVDVQAESSLVMQFFFEMLSCIYHLCNNVLKFTNDCNLDFK